MIMLVTRGEPGPDQEALLARGVKFPMPMYSCLAGFVEPGEELEVPSCARSPRRWASSDNPQVPGEPAVAVPAQPDDRVPGRTERRHRVDPTEIADAHWYRRDELPKIPPGISIARCLIDEWLAEP